MATNHAGTGVVLPSSRDVRYPLCSAVGEKGKEHVIFLYICLPHCLVIGYLQSVLVRATHFKVHASLGHLAPPQLGVLVTPPSRVPGFTFSSHDPAPSCLTFFCLIGTCQFELIQHI